MIGWLPLLFYYDFESWRADERRRKQRDRRERAEFRDAESVSPIPVYGPRWTTVPRFRNVCRRGHVEIGARTRRRCIHCAALVDAEQSGTTQVVTGS